MSPVSTKWPEEYLGIAPAQWHLTIKKGSQIGEFHYDLALYVILYKLKIILEKSCQGDL